MFGAFLVLVVGFDLKKMVIRKKGKTTKCASSKSKGEH